jgi:hypothetical protein
MSFQTEYKQRCLDIVDEILRHPISAVFHNPVDPTSDEVPDYLDVIQHPSDLSTVRTKLLNDRYRSLHEFKRDMNLIWENAVQYNGRQSLPGFIADRLSKIFQKRMTDLEEISTDQWINDFLKTRSAMCKLFRATPKGLNFASAQELPLELTVTRPRNRVSTEDLEFFKEAEAGVLKDEGLREKILQIVSEMEFGVETGGPIDLSE